MFQLDYVTAILLILAVYIASPLISRFVSALRQKRHLLSVIPAPEHHWLLGHLHTFPGLTAGGLQWHQNATVRFPRYYLFMAGPANTAVLVNHPETSKKVAAALGSKQMEGSASVYRFLKPWLGDGLIVSSGAKWHRNRRLLTSGFHFDILRQYIRVYNDCADLLLNNIAKYAVEMGKSMDIFKPIGLCTFDIILQCAFSIHVDVQNLENELEYHKSVSFMSRQVMERCFKPLVFYDILYALTGNGRRFARDCQYSHRFADDIIAKRKATLDTDDAALRRGKMTDFLDILLLARDDEGRGLTDVEIRNEAETFLFAGHDTTKSAISWCLYNLAKHPEIQSRARDEVDAILQGRTDRRIHDDDMTSLEYLTRCIRESMRMHPPVPIIGRTLDTPLEIDPGKVIPAGTKVTTMIYNLHHNPEVWPDHMTFDPDRFLPKNMKHMDSHAFMPFSAGSRNCIGQHFAMNQIRTLVARVLDRFEMRTDPEREAILHPDIVMRSVDGMYIYFENRLQ